VYHYNNTQEKHFRYAEVKHGFRLESAFIILFFVLRSGIVRFLEPPLKTSLTVILACVLGAGQAQAASFDCVAPVFPAQSTSKEGVRRVEKAVRQWRACKAAHAAEPATVDVDRLDAEVDASLAKWLAATRAYSSGQFNGQAVLAQFEREKVEYGTWLRGGGSAARASAKQL
jgi:hypothetical protein